MTLRYTDATSAQSRRAGRLAIGTFTPIGGRRLLRRRRRHTRSPGRPTAADGASGVRPDGTLGPVSIPAPTAFVFDPTAPASIAVPPISGLAPAVGIAITAAEAQALVTSALNVAFAARARRSASRPTASPQITVTVVDLDGNVLAQARTPDAAVFGADVSLPEGALGGVLLAHRRQSAFNEINPSAVPASTPRPAHSPTTSPLRKASRSARRSSTAASPCPTVRSAISRGRSIPTASTARPPGPLSLPFATLECVLDRAAARSRRVRHRHRGTGRPRPPAAGCGQRRARRPMPLPRRRCRRDNRSSPTACRSSPAACRSIAARVLVGGIGVSGDGIQQDDMIAFLGVQNGAGDAQQRAGRHPRRSARRSAARRCATSTARPRRSSTRACRTHAESAAHERHALPLPRRSRRTLAVARRVAARRMAAPAAMVDRRPAPSAMPAPPGAAPPTARAAMRHAEAMPRRAEAHWPIPPRIAGRWRRGPAGAGAGGAAAGVEPIPTPVPPPQPIETDRLLPVPDRWRILDALGRTENLFDPYNTNTLKGDKPIFGDDWFFNLGAHQRHALSSRARADAGRRRSRRARPGDQQHLRPLRPHAGQPRPTSSSLVAHQGRHRLQAARSRIPLHAGLQLQPHRCRRARRHQHQPAQGPDARRRFPRACRKPSSTTTSATCRTATTSTPCASASSRSRRFPRLPVPGQPARRAPLRQPRQQSLAVQPRLVPPPREGHQQRPQRHRPAAAQGRRLRRQSLPPGFSGARLHLAGRPIVRNDNREGSEFYYDNNGFLVRPAQIGDDRGYNYDVNYLGYNGDGHFGRLNLTASAYWRVRASGPQPVQRPAAIAARRSAPSSSPPSRRSISTGSACAAPALYRQRRRQSARAARRPASTRSSRTRNSPAPTPATGSARRIPLIGGGGVALTQPQRRARRPALVEGRGPVELHQSRARARSASAPISTSCRSCACRRTSTICASSTPRRSSSCATRRDIPNDIGYDLSVGADLPAAVHAEHRAAPSGAVLLPGAGFKALYNTRRPALFTSGNVLYSVLFNVILTY